jgi:AcrR family transcriptional regulator
MSDGLVAESGVRARTRRAILDAAIETLSQNPTASLGDIATAADVGRTTVHRYFPERSDLLRAIGRDALDKVSTARKAARLDDDAAPVALARLAQEYYEFGDVFLLLFTMPDLLSEAEWQEESDDDRALLALVHRGHREGTIDAELPAEWVQQLVWSLLYTAWEQAKAGAASKHQALSLCLRTMAKAIAV